MESESLIEWGLEIPRDYIQERRVINMKIRERMNKKLNVMLTPVAIVMGFLSLCSLSIMAYSFFTGLILSLVIWPVFILCILLIKGKKPAEKKLEKYISNFADPEEVFNYLESLPDVEGINNGDIFRFDSKYIMLLESIGTLYIAPMENVAMIRCVRDATAVNKNHAYYIQVLVVNPYAEPEEGPKAFYDSYSFKQLILNIHMKEEHIDEVMQEIAACNANMEIYEDVVFKRIGYRRYGFVPEEKN